MRRAKHTKTINRRLLRGVIYFLAAGFILLGNRLGWFTSNDSMDKPSSGFEQIQADEQSNVPSNNTQTLRLEDPLERGESHSVSGDTKVVDTRQHRRSNDNNKIAKLYQQRQSDTWVTAFGKVGKVLPDDNKGSRHQRFLLDIGQQKWLLVAHNIDLAPKVPLRQGDELIVHGEYEYNDKGGVIHWTHHDPRGYKDGGYIELNNKRYE